MRAAYDDVADWYDGWARGDAAPFMGRVGDALQRVLGAGSGLCWDLACGTGVHAGTVTALGWTHAGSDVSTRQLAHTRSCLPVVAADAAALPLPDASCSAVVAVLCHTDLPDWAAACREAARVLVPGGRLAHVGVHPCFVGAHADRDDPDRWVITAGYPYRDDHPPARRTWSGRHVQARVGATALTVTHVLSGLLRAGLVVDAVHEAGDGPAPDLLAVGARTPVHGPADRPDDPRRR